MKENEHSFIRLFRENRLFKMINLFFAILLIAVLNGQKKLQFFLILFFINAHLFAQTNALTNTSQSKYALLKSVDLNAVKWTKGFWAERFDVCKTVMVPKLWQTYTDSALCHSFQNFEIAAGIAQGNFKGPSFHDGDFYKTLEAMASMYAATHSPDLEVLMEKAIAVIGKAQMPDGYIYTKSIIQQKKNGEKKIFDDKLSFEAYNFGHLMTAACIHYRATGKTNFLEIARKATNFLIKFYNNATPEQARNAICPSHYMGIIEMYRTTQDEKYLALATKLIDIRGKTPDGTDDNSDRIPFRQMQTINGHAVRANYLCAGVADLYAETGDKSLLITLDNLWNDIVNRKMYVTGGCGALYDGVSPSGTSYKPDSIQKVHQSYGQAFQLPNLTAHNETCANIGNLLWNWRMLQITGQAKYADIMELSLYNSILSGVSLEGSKYFYTNPLSASNDYPNQLRWMGGRSAYIKRSNCCPPNLVRTIAEVNGYAYNISEKGLWVNLYGSNILKTSLLDGSTIQLSQESDYPWNGLIKFQLNEVPENEFSIFFRIPSWCTNATLKINGIVQKEALNMGEYVEIHRKWAKNTTVELNLAMPVQLIEANPLVEETRNQIAVKRGPIVYCIESIDNPNVKISTLSIPIDAQFTTKEITFDNSKILALETDAKIFDNINWQNKLYREVKKQSDKHLKIRLIPYYSWSNRGKSEMNVWQPISR